MCIDHHVGEKRPGTGLGSGGLFRRRNQRPHMEPRPLASSLRYTYGRFLRRRVHSCPRSWVHSYRAWLQDTRMYFFCILMSPLFGLRRLGTPVLLIRLFFCLSRLVFHVLSFVLAPLRRASHLLFFLHTSLYDPSIRCLRY